MKKKIVILGVCSLLLCGCGKIPKLSNGDEAVVTFKDGKISANDFYNQIKNTYGLETLVSMIDTYIYEKEFADKVSEATKYAEAFVKSIKENATSEAEALQYVQGMYGAKSFEEFQKKMYLNYLQNEAIMKYVKGKITEDELKKFYEDEVYPDMTLAHILVKANVTSTMTEDEKKKAEDTAKEKINKALTELNKARENKEDIIKKFGELAKTYSEDDSNKNNGGSLGEINIGSLNSTYDELIKAASKLNDNDYSPSIITTEAGYHIILKTKTGTKKSYEEALDTMKERISNNKLSDTKGQVLMIEAVKAYREDYKLDIVDSEVNREYGKYMNNLVNNANSAATSNN